MKRKILSLALALMMILSVAAAMPVSADVPDTILNVNDDGVIQTGTTASAQDVIGGTASDWNLTHRFVINSNSRFIEWAFNVPESGLYDILVATSYDYTDDAPILKVWLNNSTTFDTLTPIRYDGEIAEGKDWKSYAMETVYATDVYFDKDIESTLKLGRSTGGTSVYAVKLVYKPAVQYTITAVADPAEGGTVTGTATVEEGETVTLTATANEGYSFIGWFDEDDQPASEEAEFVVTATADKTYKAKFEEIVFEEGDEFIIGVTNNDLGTVESSKTSLTDTDVIGGTAYEWLYDVNTTKRIAMNGKYYTQWNLNVPASGLYDIYVAANYNATGTAAKLDVELDGVAKGTVDVIAYTGDIESGQTWDDYSMQTEIATNVRFNEDAQITLKLTRNVGSPSVYGVKLVYKGNKYIITANATEGGSVSPETQTVEEGATATLTATANTGYSFIGWYDESDALVSTNAVYTVTATADATYTAKFQEMGVVNVHFGDCTTIGGTGGVLDTSYNPTSGPDWAQNTTGGFRVNGSKSTHYVYGVSQTFNVTEAGWYEVHVGAATPNTAGDIRAKVYVNGLTAEGNLNANGDRYDAKDNNLGDLVYLNAGTNTLKCYAYNNQVSYTDGEETKATYTYIFAVRFEKKDAPDEVIIDMSEFDGKSSASTSDFNAPEGVAWTPSGFTDNSSDEYTVYVPKTGYYDIKVAAATPNDTGIFSLSVNGTEYVNGGHIIKTAGYTKETAENNAGKIYLKAGYNTIQYKGNGYAYGMKLSYVNEALTAGGLKLVGNDGLAIEGEIDAYTNVYGEIITEIENAKIYVVNYREVDGIKEMVSCTEGTVVVTDNGLNIIRTSSALSTAAGTVKVFLWSNDGNFTPLMAPSADVTILPVLTPEE